MSLLRPAVLKSQLLLDFEQGKFLASLKGADLLIAINDPARATNTRLMLETLAPLLGHNSQAARSIEIIVATGTHHFSSTERSAFEETTLGKSGLAVQGVSWHDADDPQQLAPLDGRRLNRKLVEARAVLAIGSVEPHYFAGATGAHKTLTIGLMSRADIERNHAGALHPNSDILHLAGNPVHDDICEVLRSVQRGRTVLAINQVLAGDSVAEVAVGDPLETLQRLTPTAAQIYLHTIPEPVDVLHLRVPLPLGRDLYQADKALKNNHRSVRDGGCIVLEAECPDGVGPSAFLGLLRQADTYAEAVRVVGERGYRLGDHKAVKLRALTEPAQRGVRVILVSRQVDAADARLCGMTVVSDITTGLQLATEGANAAPLAGLRIEDAGVVSVTPRAALAGNHAPA